MMDDTSQDTSLSSEDDGAQCKQPYRRLEFAVNQVVDVAIPLHLKTLRSQLDAIESFQAQKKWTSVVSEQVKASNTFRLLKADIHELENLNFLVRPEDSDIFLEKIRTPTREVVDALATFQDFHPGIMQPLFNLQNDSEQEYPDIPPLRCNELEGESDPPEESSLICNLTEVKLKEKSKVAQHWLALKHELTEVSELIKKFAGLVLFQRESVDRIEENISSTQTNVEAGARHLSRANLLKSASIPLTGAVIGGLIFGPAGAFVGFKLFGSAACAVSGGLLGYGVGRKLKEKQKVSCELEMKALTAPPSKSSSTSLPDLTEALRDTQTEVFEVCITVIMVNENDMPLVANTTDIVVRHYILNLACDFGKKIFSGRIVLFLEPVELIDKPAGAITKSKCNCKQTESRFASKTGCKTYNPLCDTLFTCAESELNLEEVSKGEGQLSASEDANKENDKFGGKANKGKAKNEDRGKDAHAKGEFMCILDCCQLNVKSVKEVEIDTDQFMSRRFSHHNLQFSPKCSLDFSVDDWSLQIWKEGVYCRFCFPKFIEIEYETIPEGKSLLWVDDQDGKPAVFTYGAWINNRALFPCQEPPAAMATWSATVTTCEPAVVLMSGDKDPVIYSHNDMLHYFYHSEAALPMATLSLAVGFWKGEKIQNRNSDSNSKTSNIAYRIFAPPSLFEKAKKEFSDYLVRAVDVAVSFLGEYPFPRIDLLIVPRGFGSLGMANPNLIFLSQSLLAGDRSMCIRVAHEVAHAWFGLLIGSSDWTEEWLSEGFATFMEDLIHSKTVYMSSAEKTDFLELRSFLRLKTLQAEMENVDPELLKLSPNEGKVITESIDGKEAIVIKNGQNPGKAFIQVHYIKGFFILKHLSNIVGLWHFLDFLKSYVERYRRQLVGSKEVFEMFIETFPQICDIEKITLDGLISHWLQSSKIPQEISTAQPSDSNNLFKVALSEAKRWKTSNKALLKRKPYAKKRKKYSLDSYVNLSAIQLTFLLEELLGESKLSPVLMKKLERTYDMSNANADVKHRWCELVVKHRYFPGYVCLSQFLRDDLAMGIYLYSELIYSGAPSHRTIVEESLRSVISEMEPNYKSTISEMLEDALH